MNAYFCVLMNDFTSEHVCYDSVFVLFTAAALSVLVQLYHLLAALPVAVAEKLWYVLQNCFLFESEVQGRRPGVQGHQLVPRLRCLLLHLLCQDCDLSTAVRDWQPYLLLLQARGCKSRDSRSPTSSDNAPAALWSQFFGLHKRHSFFLVVSSEAFFEVCTLLYRARLYLLVVLSPSPNVSGRFDDGLVNLLTRGLTSVIMQLMSCLILIGYKRTLLLQNKIPVFRDIQ